MAFLAPIAIAKLETLALRAKVIVEGALTGSHRAKLRGSSVEFAEHKEYSQGDEIRHVDWKVLGKADRYYIKQFEQESELTCYLVLDASASMNYVGRSLGKREYACNLIGALAYLLVGQRDRVGLSIFGDARNVRWAQPKAKADHLRTLLAMLEEVSDSPQVGDEVLSSALERLAELARKRRGLIIVASDLFETEGDAPSVLGHLRARGHDVVLFHTLDRDELDFPFEGLSIFESLEGDGRLLVDPASIRRIYQEKMKGFLEHCEQQCLSQGIEYHRVCTDQPFEEVLLGFLAERAGVAGSSSQRPRGQAT
ncbi:MAG: DUF58 domain-containing protein [Myxococcales bacterium]|nr:DUF58 domain-containing protein [Myxococcales bacterium]